MIPVGYLYKNVATRPDWLSSNAVTRICSLSNCISQPFADYIGFWEHNGYWLFDSPEIMQRIAAREAIDLSGASLFYYEAHGDVFDDGSKSWSEFRPEASIATNVERPRSSRILGYDVVTFHGGAGPECSPLSCNSLAEYIPVNEHCLLSSFEEAKAALEAGLFANTEPGPFRILAVYAIDRS